jgi:hypothetical protein
MIVIRYYKSQSRYDAPTIVPRFLPPRLGQIMALYLSYLQPFEEYLVVQVLGDRVHDYIWGSEGAWSTDRLMQTARYRTAYAALPSYSSRYWSGQGRRVVWSGLLG